MQSAVFTPAVFSKLSLKQAADVWLRMREQRAAPRTIATDEYHLRALLRCFDAAAPLLSLTPADLHNYQQWRKQAHPEIGLRVAGASAINHELSVVQQLLKRAGMWDNFREWYEPLPLPKLSPGKALTAEQEQTLFRVASSRPRWLVAYCAIVISANTTAGPGEILNLQLCDVDLDHHPPLIHIRQGAKNEFRIRPLPLNADAVWAVRTLLDRAHSKGATEPQHYLIPHRADKAEGRSYHRAYDPTRPATCWRSAWRALCKLAGLVGLRPYDLRHHAITKLLENPDNSEQTVIDIAGHVSRKMLRTYSHIRTVAKQEAVTRLAASPIPKPVYSFAKPKPHGETAVSSTLEYFLRQEGRKKL